MSFFNQRTQLDSKGEVKLGDEIQMVILVTNNDNGYFDISAKSCFASGITLIEDRCPVDEDLVGLFNSSAVGYLSNTFSMFRPTSISGGPFEVVFTCILEVCLWNCDENACITEGDTSSGTSRKRRRAGIRPADGQSNPSVVRGFTLTAVAEGEETAVSRKKPNVDMCIPITVVAALIGLFIIIVGVGGAIFAITYKYYCNYMKSIASLKERKDGHEKQTIENQSDKPEGNQKTNCIRAQISTGIEDELQNMSRETNEATSGSDKSKYTEHLQALEVHLKSRHDNQKPYRRTSLSVAGMASFPEKKTHTGT
ncbi:uncharacterized protein LOC123553527 [Mercenaria mercenaria]|uniref:uncharacterized protein LOC123553527 n=1 Tax=Mercenaria mercenaria TaxID=6596 RepID=UPI00234EE5AA|nr:uncharacterized protein LOC123553527 [Mercenaria mercenaria]